MKPTIGRTVIYNLRQSEQEGLSLFGNKSTQLPAVVVAVWSESLINLKVITDGASPDLWRTSVYQGNEEGQWQWPEIVADKEGV